MVGDDGRDRDVHVFTPCVPWVCLGSSKSLMSVVMNLAPGVERTLLNRILAVVSPAVFVLTSNG